MFVPKNARCIPANATRVFQGVIFDVYQWQQELFDGSRETFEMLKRPDSVNVIAVKDDKVIVLEQEQPGVNFFYSFPGGRHDVESESELQAAKRELVEETGMTFLNWKLISAIQPHWKIDWIVYTFLATGFVSQTAQKLDGGERITVTLKTIEEIKKLNLDPNTRYLAKDIFWALHSVQELAALPALSR
jgi:ADP-ribose pyrophosphatase